MSVADLLLAGNGLSPEDRYVLIRLGLPASPSEPLALGTRALSKAWGISEAKLSRAIGSLIRFNILVDARQSTGRGRPKQLLRLADAWGAEVLSEFVSQTPHIEVIARLLNSCARTEQVEGGKQQMAGFRSARIPSRLSVVNCVLLTVLWSLADPFGVVESVGNKELCKLTGLDQSSLKHRLGRLTEQGFISQYVPGGYSQMLGGRLESVYVLNCAHALLVDVERRPALLDYFSTQGMAVDEGGWPWTAHYHAEALQRLDKDPLTYCESTFGRYHWVLRRGESAVYFWHLPLRLCQYVHAVLSCQRSEVLGREFLEELLRDRIKRDFHGARLSDGRLWARLCQVEPAATAISEPDLRAGSASAQRDLVRVVCVYVRKMAEIIRSRADYIDASNWENYRILWLNHLKGNEGFSLLRRHSGAYD